ncbi:MAG: cysteine desulfurase [Hyphomicrobiaceae bacterium]|nr:cysteine desulfurase [Hyphomicrobiaceae bacterium]
MHNTEQKFHTKNNVCVFDVNRIRNDFPILCCNVNDKPLVYLDNAASAQKPSVVIEAMNYALRHEYSNVHRGIHYLSNAATQRFEDTRETCRVFLNARHSDEIIFTKNATEAINLVALTWGMNNLQQDDEIILSIMEHHANIVPWHFLRERKGAIIKWALVDDDGTFDLDQFEKLITPRTKVVSLTHMSNVLGTVIPIKEVIRIAHQHNIMVFVDAAQSAVHMSVDVRDLDADFLCFSGHKVYGPSGIGVLYGKREFLNNLPPFLGGGAMIENVTTDNVTYGPPPSRFEAGTPAIVEAVGLTAALNYMIKSDRQAIATHENSLTLYAQEQLKAFNWLRIHGTTRNKGGIVSFTVDGLHPHDISMVIDRSGVAIRAGHLCTQPLMQHYGITAMCRASFGMYNTFRDIDIFVEALEKAYNLFK